MIIDSSTLILLAKSGLLDLINNLEITEKIKEESIAAKDSFDSKLIKKRIEEKKIKVVEIKNTAYYERLLKDFNLGKGEAEAITAAYEKKEVLLCDDKKAINTCRILNIKFATALNILVKLNNNKTINKDKAKHILKNLIFYGRYAEDLINKVEDDLK